MAAGAEPVLRTPLRLLSMARPCKATILTAALRHNVAVVRDRAPTSSVMACVKADGYGHGATTVAEAIADLVDGFAVACIEEALALRDHGVRNPILLLEGPLSPDELPLAAAHRLTLSINSPQQLQWLSDGRLTDPVHCWLKLDSGMHRLGFAPDTVAATFRRLNALDNVVGVEVICSHFARADAPDDAANTAQEATFDQAVADLDAQHSLANSAAILTRPGSHRAWVRPGYMLYGGSPFEARSPESFGLRPAMELSTAVIDVRDVAAGEAVGYGGRWVAPRPSRIATLAVGYGDGYPRHARDGTPVLVEGRIAPLAGRVSMDMITVDVTDNPAVQPGSRAVLWGASPGVDTIASHADTIGYELLAGMPPRTPRVKETP